jgi:NADH dehydrogenase FAD-containing subunit
MSTREVGDLESLSIRIEVLEEEITDLENRVPPALETMIVSAGGGICGMEVAVRLAEVEELTAALELFTR